MTSISHQPVLPPQTPGNTSQAIAPAHPTSTSASGKTSPQAALPAPATARSYANATKKPFSSSSASSNPTPSVAGALSAPIQHGKSDTISPMNGKNSIPPAIPAFGAPAIANGNSAANNSLGVSDHSRQPSVTISAAGTSGYTINGGSVGGKPTGGNGIQFGSINAGGSPVAPQSTHQLSQSANSLAVNIPSNPRISSPQTSPSPIPQPPASGGRPPSSLQSQGNGLSFGSLGGEDANVRLYNSCCDISLANFILATTSTWWNTTGTTRSRTATGSSSSRVFAIHTQRPEQPWNGSRFRTRWLSTARR